jgi:asparagine synthase (glutamine-hydrolysing)
MCGWRNNWIGSEVYLGALVGESTLPQCSKRLLGSAATLYRSYFAFIHKLSIGGKMSLHGEDPYIKITQNQNQTLTEGQRDVLLGHEVPKGSDTPDGVWARWSWNEKRLLVQTDSLGFYPLYYFAHESGIIVSPSIPKLLELDADAELDAAALSVFLRLGYFIGEDTPFRHIRALPPSGRLDWQRGVLRLHRALPKATPVTMRRSEAIEEYATLFAEAIERRPPQGSYAVPLSGGQDSRHIAFELSAQGHRPHCVTAHPLAVYLGSEATTAAQVAERLGLPFYAVAQGMPAFVSERKKNLRTNFCADEHGWYMSLAEHLCSNFDTVYDGLGGDVLSAGLFLDQERLDLMREGRFAEMAEQLLPRETLLQALMQPDAYDRFQRGLAVSHLAQELELHADAPNPVGQFFFFNRTRREIALSPYRLLGSIKRVYTPYLDHAVFEFLSSLPAEHFLDKRFHLECIAQTYPQHAQVPYHRRSSGRRPDWAGASAYAMSLMLELARPSAGSLMRPFYVLPRLVRCLLQRSYSPEFITNLGPLLSYLTQLEGQVKAGNRSRQTGRDPLFLARGIRASGNHYGGMARRVLQQSPPKDGAD